MLCVLNRMLHVLKWMLLVLNRMLGVLNRMKKGVVGIFLICKVHYQARFVA